MEQQKYDCGIEVKKDTYLSLDQRGRDGVIYDYLDVIYKRINAIEVKDKADAKRATYVGGIAGFFGGATTVIMYFLSKFFFSH